MNRSIVFLCAFAFTANTGADAQKFGWYAGVGSGEFRTKAVANQAANDTAIAALGGSEISSGESGEKAPLLLSLGYRVSWLSIEASYLDLGEVHHYSATFKRGDDNGHSVASWEAKRALGTAAVGSWPIRNGFGVVAKIAAYRLSGDFRTETTVRRARDEPPPGTGRAGDLLFRSERSGSGSGTVPAFGIGATYDLSDALRVRGMYERWANKSGLFGEGNDLKRLSLFALSAVVEF